MNKFFDSPECRSGSHCRICRARTAGASFRTSIAAYFSLPSTDWDCPHGRPWGLDNKPDALPFVATTTQPSAAPTTAPSQNPTIQPPFDTAPWTPPENAAELCATCPANGSCPNYCVTCGGKFTIVGPCPIGRW